MLSGSRTGEDGQRELEKRQVPRASNVSVITWKVSSLAGRDPVAPCRLSSLIFQK